MKIVLIITICYLLGSLPFGYIMGKLFKKVDIREFGSGNIGASNVLRTLGPLLASLVIIGDVGKGILSIYLVKYFNIDSSLILAIAGLAVICGHDLSLIHISEPTRLGMISYAVFCLKKKNKKII